MLIFQKPYKCDEHNSARGIGIKVSISAQEKVLIKNAEIIKFSYNSKEFSYKLLVPWTIFLYITYEVGNTHGILIQGIQ